MAKTLPSIMRRPETRGLTKTGYANGATIFTGTTISGPTITPQVALTLTSVFSAINVISRDFASLKPRVKQEIRGGGWKPAPKMQVDKILRREINPARPRSTPIRFLQTIMAHTLGHGSGYAEIYRDGDGYPYGLELLNPLTTYAAEDDRNQLYYKTENGDRRPEDILHLAGLSFDGVSGYTPVGMCREAVGLGKAAEQFGASVFGNGAIPKGYVKIPHKLTDTAKRNLRNDIYGVHQGAAKANSLMILDPGYEFVPTQINPDDAQFLATRQFQVLEIARIYNLPPHKIGDYSQAHLANVEESNLEYLTTTLRAWVAMFEAECDYKLLSERDSERYAIRCDMSEMLRGNSEARIKYWTGMRNLGAANADEIRISEGMNPIGPAKGGDKYLIGLNLTTLEKAGDPVEPAPKPAIEPAESNDESKADE